MLIAVTGTPAAHGRQPLLQAGHLPKRGPFLADNGGRVSTVAAEADARSCMGKVTLDFTTFYSRFISFERVELPQEYNLQEVISKVLT